MNYDVECPYCGKNMYVCNDDGHGLVEDDVYEEECPNCNNKFALTVSYSAYYYGNKAPCMNGEPHNYSVSETITSISKTCKWCDKSEHIWKEI